MRFEVSSSELLKQLNIASGAINANPVLPIMEDFLFDVKNNVFSFKKIADGTKAKQNISGYNLTLINSSTDTFALEQNVPFEGENVKVIYNFQRVN